MTRDVGFIVFPGFNLLDLSGPLAVFETANRHLREPYRLGIHSNSAAPVSSSTQIPLITQPLPTAVLDTLIVVGGAGVNNAVEDKNLLKFIGNPQHARRHVSVCTGTFLLAASGLLSGRRATTHWYRAPELGRRYPDITLQPDHIVVQDGNVWSSAGATAGMDIALALLEADHGQGLVDTVARELLIPKRRTRGQLRFMPLNDLNPPSPRIQRIVAYICSHFADPLTVEVLAEKAHLSPRQFSREFRSQTGLTPAKAVEQARVYRARYLVESTNDSLADIARQSGFSNEALMRKAFLRCLQLTPKQLRVAQLFDSCCEATKGL